MKKLSNEELIKLAEKKLADDTALKVNSGMTLEEIKKADQSVTEKDVDNSKYSDVVKNAVKKIIRKKSKH